MASRRPGGDLTARAMAVIETADTAAMAAWRGDVTRKDARLALGRAALALEGLANLSGTSLRKAMQEALVETFIGSGDDAAEAERRRPQGQQAGPGTAPAEAGQDQADRRAERSGRPAEEAEAQGQALGTGQL